MAKKIKPKGVKRHKHVWTPAMGQSLSCPCGVSRAQPYDMDKGAREAAGLTPSVVAARGPHPA